MDIAKKAPDTLEYMHFQGNRSTFNNYTTYGLVRTCVNRNIPDFESSVGFHGNGM